MRRRDAGRPEIGRPQIRVDVGADALQQCVVRDAASALEAASVDVPDAGLFAVYGADWAAEPLEPPESVAPAVTGQMKMAGSAKSAS